MSMPPRCEDVHKFKGRCVLPAGHEQHHVFETEDARARESMPTVYGVIKQRVVPFVEVVCHKCQTVVRFEERGAVLKVDKAQKVAIMCHNPKCYSRFWVTRRMMLTAN